MIKSPMPGMTGASLMTDTLEFVKNLWGGMNIPGVVVPTVSVDEMDKKIADLKAVESWLNLNMSMLRSSIQALEVQRATIATLKAMTETMSETMGGSAKPGEADKSGFMSSPFAPAFSFPTAAAAPAPASASAAAPAETPAPAAAASDKDQPAVKEKSEQAEKAGAMPDLNAQMTNAAAWWNLLQDQFRQAVSSAVASETSLSKSEKSDKKAAPNGNTAAKPAGTAQKAATKTKAAPRSKRVPPKT